MLKYEEVLELLADRPEATRTYPVASDLLRRLPLDTSPHLRAMDEGETQELADHLEVPAAAIEGPLRVVDVKCSYCDRVITFLDFVKTAIDDGQHDLAQLREVLTGRNGAWITIRGRDGGRPVRCAGCDRTVDVTRRKGGGEYSEYSSGSYAYA
ncbi:hypothetical protein STRCI_000030 [Streptomyces cinnabarinus]|uniref:Uncharacterized protein n=1 Tax=Streptomyces cinnabarinus TaxID=67287 RepID=A0ABY7K4E9_9ACTN|nr:hypothetical protein [Streptomyces cinnabarinus]WAZ19013.1 hypothetical protein STRCI_000030 [Streptomyces cinnabarinus]